ncbi:MAG: hypothetical protein VKO00_08915 [Cyanobacteriota bacterium]|nr:hypothetical protein [Cyanobacteriota bacterium]
MGISEQQGVAILVAHHKTTPLGALRITTTTPSLALRNNASLESC